MRSRKKIVSVSDMVKDPDMRIVFQKEHHREFLELLSIGEKYSMNPTTLSRHLILIFVRKINAAQEAPEKNKIMTEIMQSVHGMTQINIFDKPVTLENSAIVLRKPAKPKPKPKPAANRNRGLKK